MPSFAIFVGLQEDFDISTINGAVTIALASGSFDVETVNGGIDFDGALAPGGSNRMTTVNGSVAIKLQGTPNVRLDASSANGSVTSELPILTHLLRFAVFPQILQDGLFELRRRMPVVVRAPCSWAC